MKRSLLAGLVVLAVAIPAMAGAATAPTISIGSPTTGASFSRTFFESIPVSGLATFDAPVASTKTFYAHRDGCADSNDPKYLSVTAGAGETEGCQYVLPPAAVDAAGGAEETFPTQDGVPVTLDASRNLHVRIQADGSTSLGVGLADLSYQLNATKTNGQSVQLGSGTKQYPVTPLSADYVSDFNIDLPDSVHNVSFRDLTLVVKIVGAQAQHGGLDYNGQTFIEVPIFDGGTVQVSSDSATFSAAKTVNATLNANGTWNAEVVVPNTGSRKIYARAIQGAVTTNATPVSITVTA
jgi:hypothetical protein